MIIKLYDDDENEIPLPTYFEVCSQCRGTGKSSAYLGAFTSSEWEEQDYEFREDYMAGHYDRTCETCGGKRVEEFVDEDRLTDEQKRAYRKAVKDEMSYLRMWQAERDRGA